MLGLQSIIIVKHNEYQLLKSVTVQTSDTELEWFKKSKWVFQSKIILVSNVVNIGAISVGSIMTFSNDKSWIFFLIGRDLNTQPEFTPFSYLYKAGPERGSDSAEKVIPETL